MNCSTANVINKTVYLSSVLKEIECLASQEHRNSKVESKANEVISDECDISMDVLQINIVLSLSVRLEQFDFVSQFQNYLGK